MSIQEIDSLNQRLSELLGDSEKLNFLQQTRQSRKSLTIQRLREHATALYYFLAKQWPCSCDASHTARVFLTQKRILGDDPERVRKRHLPAPCPAVFQISMAVQGSDDGQMTWRGPYHCTLDEYIPVNAVTTDKDHFPPKHAPLGSAEKLSMKKSVKFQETSIALNRPQSTLQGLAKGGDDDAIRYTKPCGLCLGLESMRMSPSQGSLGPYIQGVQHTSLL